jgi:phosphatase NudJ
MPREPIPSWYYALIVVRKEDRFLIVQERKHNQTWYLPAGRVEQGETFEQAARRECLEESGLQVELTDVVRFEHTPTPHGTRIRIIYLAKPVDDTEPKSEPDDESLQARWVTLKELEDYELRSHEVKTLFQLVSNGCRLLPVDSITVVRD